jgi:Helix-turn-helix domain
MQSEHTSANIELKPKRTTKGREEQRREKQRLETAESKKVQREKLMASTAAAEASQKRVRGKGKLKKRKLKPPNIAAKISAPIVATEYMTTIEAASYLKLSRQFLEAARYRGDGSGPPYIKLDRAVRYRRSVLDQWMTAHDHSPDKPIYTE